MSEASMRDCIEFAEEAVIEATCFLENKLDVLADFDPKEEPAFAPILANLRDALLSYAVAVCAFRETPASVAEAFGGMKIAGKSSEELSVDLQHLQGRMQRAVARQSEGRT